MMTKDHSLPWQAQFVKLRDHQEIMALAIESRDDETLMDLERHTLDLLDQTRRISKEIDQASSGFPGEGGDLPLTVSSIEEAIIQARTALEKNMNSLRVWMNDIQKHLANRRLYSSSQAGVSRGGAFVEAGFSQPAGRVSNMFEIGAPVGRTLGKQVDSES